MEDLKYQKLFTDLPIPDYFEKFDVMESMILNENEEQIPEIIEYIKENFEINEYEQCYLTVIYFSIRFPRKLVFYGRLYLAMMKEIEHYPISYTLVHNNSLLARYVYLNGGYDLDQFNLCRNLSTTYEYCFGSDHRKGLTEEELQNIYDQGSIEQIIFNDDVEKLLELSTNPQFDYNQNIETAAFHFTDFPRKYSILSFACLYQSIECFKFLKMNGSNLTPSEFECAVAGGNLEIIHITQRETPDVGSVLSKAVIFHRNEIADWLLTLYPTLQASIDNAIEGFNTRAVYFYITEPLRSSRRFVQYDWDVSWAASKGYILLLKHYIKINKEFHASLFTDPILAAVTCRSLEAIKLMNEHGYNMNVIQFAAYGDDVDLAKYYITKSSENEMEMTMQQCVKFNAVNVARVLFENGYVSKTHHHMPSSEMKKLFDEFRQGSESDNSEAEEE